jgi:hypothetical protein
LAKGIAMGPYPVPPVRTQLGLVIRESAKEMERRILHAASLEVDERFARADNNIERMLKMKVVSWLLSSPEILSLMSQSENSLKGDFGLTNPSASVMSIIEAVQDSIEIEQMRVKTTTGFLVLRIKIQPKHMGNVISAVDPVQTEKGANLPWIEWLLLKGDEIIITDYHVEPKIGTGRSGLATMKAGGEYTVGRVNPAYSGTQDDNFITRALKGKERDIEAAIVIGMRL